MLTHRKGIKIIPILVLIVFVILIILAFVMTRPASNADTTEPETETTVPETTQPPLINTPLLYPELIVYEFETIEEAQEFINITMEAIDLISSELGTIDTYTQEALSAMQVERTRLDVELTSARRQEATFIKWEEKEFEYYYATRTWKYLKDLGYSDVACAGIIGNLMAECGGHTLKLNPFLYDKATGSYYGMFQWSMKYYPAIVGAGFEEQLDYYAKTSIPIFRTWGKNYAAGFTLDDFNELTDPREAALAFAKIYERCASWTYERRQNFAEVAYKYFVSDFEEIE